MQHQNLQKMYLNKLVLCLLYHTSGMLLSQNVPLKRKVHSKEQKKKNSLFVQRCNRNPLGSRQAINAETEGRGEG